MHAVITVAVLPVAVELDGPAPVQFANLDSFLSRRMMSFMAPVTITY